MSFRGRNGGVPLQTSNYIMIDLISYRYLPWCNHIDHFFVSYHFIYLMAQSAPHWWGMFFTQQTSCLPHVFLIHSSWYIGIYTVDTLLYSLCFTNCIILFLPLLSIHPRVFTWVLQPELLLKVVTSYILYGLPLHQKGNVSKATC